MPRKQFIADLQAAQQGVLPAGVLAVRQGGDDGQVEFEYTGAPPDVVKITAFVTDLGDYPSSHQYMIFCGDDAPRRIATALQTARGTDCKTVFELLDIISAILSQSPPDGDGDTQMADSQPEEDYDADSDDNIYDSDHESFDQGGPQHTTPYTPSAAPSAKLRPADRTFRARIRSDLRAAKEAGFKVGVLGYILEGCNAYVTVSIRMSKLGISEEAMQA